MLPLPRESKPPELRSFWRVQTIPFNCVAARSFLDIDALVTVRRNHIVVDVVAIRPINSTVWRTSAAQLFRSNPDIDALAVLAAVFVDEIEVAAGRDF